MGEVAAASHAIIRPSISLLKTPNVFLGVLKPLPTTHLRPTTINHNPEDTRTYFSRIVMAIAKYIKVRFASD
jgi:hypothetical protein